MHRGVIVPLAIVASIIIATAALASGQGASTPSTPVNDRWVKFGENERLVAYHQGVRRGDTGTLTVWVLYDYKTEQHSPVSGRRYFSQKGQQEVDCRGDKSRTMFFTWHAGRMTAGAVVYTGRNALPWEPTSPGSIAMALSAAVCTSPLDSALSLTRLASEFNKALPMMVDRNTELSTVGVIPNGLVYNYRLVSIVASELTPEQLVERLRPATMKQACTTPETRNGVLNLGITMRFSYRDRNGVFIGAFNVASADCDKTRLTSWSRFSIAGLLRASGG